jgi:restriction system protein
MPIPDFQTLMLPVLRKAETTEVRIGEVIASLADDFQLTEEERAELLPSRRQGLFANRVHWAKFYLSKAGLVEITGRGRFAITPKGADVLSSSPERITIRFLEQFPEFVAFRNASRSERVEPPVAQETENETATPDELIRRAHAELDAELGAELLHRLQKTSPNFFENTLISLFVAMGYGGTAENAGQSLVVGKSNDGGIDGVIDQDHLGLDRVYIQAKRYADGNVVGSGAIRDFFGALDAYKAAKGLFVTTSDFSPAARQTADNLSKRIVLINGKQLTRLMMRFGIGCRIEETFHIKKVDEDFFDPDGSRSF